MTLTAVLGAGHVHAALWDALKAGFHFITQGSDQFIDGELIDLRYTMYHTLRLAVDATLIAALIGLPLGCLLGLGRFRGRGLVLAIGNGLTRVPPVVVGVFLVVATSSESGTLAASKTLHTFSGPLVGVVGAGFSTPLVSVTVDRIVLAQTLLALPIMITLTATAVQRVPVALLDQAEAFGAPRWRRSLLALREARGAVVAAIIVAMGITITAVGAVYILGGAFGSCGARVAHEVGQDCRRQGSLAYGALTEWNGNLPHTQVAVAYAELLMGLFIISAAALTFLQQTRSSWIAGAQS